MTAKTSSHKGGEEALGESDSTSLMGWSLKWHKNRAKYAFKNAPKTRRHFLLEGFIMQLYMAQESTLLSLKDRKEGETTANACVSLQDQAVDNSEYNKSS